MSRDLNGTTQWMSIGSNGLPFNGYPFTVAGWFYRHTNGSQMAVFYITVNNSGNSVSVRAESGTGVVNMWDGINSRQCGNTSSLNTWNHVAVIWNNSTDRRIVLNGDWANSYQDTTSQTMSCTAANITFGANIPGTVWWFDGLEAYWSIWRAALSQSEIESLAAGAVPDTVSAANLYNYWKMAGTASPEPDDKNGYSLTLTGSPGQGASDPSLNFSVSVNLSGLAASAASGNPSGAVVAVGQGLRAASDISNAGNWRRSSDDSTSGLYTMMDESPADDSDYVYVRAGSAVSEVSLTAGTDPLLSTGHYLRYRARSIQSKSAVFSLYQGASLIAEWTESLSPIWQSFEHTLSAGQADSITNYADLRLRLTSVS